MNIWDCGGNPGPKEDQEWSGKDKLDFLLRTLSVFPLVFRWRHVVQGGMHARPIAIELYVLEDVLLGLVPRPMAPLFHQFPFQRPEERLGRMMRNARFSLTVMPLFRSSRSMRRQP